MLRIALLRWTNVHDKDVSELNTKLDTQNREEMKILKQKAKDKSELERYEVDLNVKYLKIVHLCAVTFHCTFSIRICVKYIAGLVFRRSVWLTRIRFIHKFCFAG